MAHAEDVAQYILEKIGKTITTIKLQKLVYYCQAWSLVWTEKPLFDEDIQAWANGPVVPSLYAKHRGLFEISADNDLGGSSANLTPDEKDTIDHVLEGYGDKPAMYLVQLSHAEQPWAEARGAVPAGVRCANVISKAAMAEYYSAL